MAAKTEKSMMLCVAKGAFAGAGVSIALILVYALALYKGWLAPDTAQIVTPAVKIACAALAGLIAARRMPNKKLLCGLITGLVYILLAFMLFSILSSSFTFSLALLTDAAMGMAAAAVAVLVRSMIG